MPALTGENVEHLIDAIDALLPQTQCGQCGYPGCRPYATALAEQRDSINKCPPGGEAGIHALATLLHYDYQPFAADGPQPKPRTVAVIAEESCIGCTLCIQACPVDAIVGAAKQMHTVIASECTGCELCVAPCPVDCITLHPLPEPNDTVSARDDLLRRAVQYRERYRFRQYRLQRDREERAQRLAEKAAQARRDAQTRHES